MRGPLQEKNESLKKVGKKKHRRLLITIREIL